MVKKAKTKGGSKTRAKGKGSRVNDGTVGMFQNPPKGSGPYDFMSKRSADALYFET